MAQGILAFHHTNPSHPVHIVVIPKEHVPSLTDLGNAEEVLLKEVVTVVREVAAGVEREYGACSVTTNLGPYQEPKHMHWHGTYRGESEVETRGMYGNHEWPCSTGDDPPLAGRDQRRARLRLPVPDGRPVRRGGRRTGQRMPGRVRRCRSAARRRRRGSAPGAERRRRALSSWSPGLTEAGNGTRTAGSSRASSSARAVAPARPMTRPARANACGMSCRYSSCRYPGRSANWGARLPLPTTCSTLYHSDRAAS